MTCHTFALQLVHHGDVVEGDDGEHGLRSGQSQTFLEDGGDVRRHQLLRQALVVGDEHDDDEQAVPHRQPTAAQMTDYQIIRIRASQRVTPEPAASLTL